MPDFYKFEIAAWNDGTDNLSLEQEAAYLRVVNTIRLTGKPINDNKFILAGLWRCGHVKAKRIRQELIDAGKLVIRDGQIVNKRAIKDAADLNDLRGKRSDAGTAGGIASGASRRAKAAKDSIEDPREVPGNSAATPPQLEGAEQLPETSREVADENGIPKPLKSIDQCEASASTREEKRREEKNNPLPPFQGVRVSFSDFWEECPVKTKQERTQKEWGALSDEDRARAIQAVRPWYAWFTKAHPKSAKLSPARFLTERRWTDEDWRVPEGDDTPQRPDRDLALFYANAMNEGRFVSTNLSTEIVAEILDRKLVPREVMQKKGFL